LLLHGYHRRRCISRVLRKGTIRNNDPSILPEPGKPFQIRYLSEEQDLELADALLQNTSVTDLELMDIASFTKSSAEAIAKYVRTSKRLQRIRWPRNLIEDHRESVLRHREEMLCCFMPAFQESASLKELDMELPLVGGSSDLSLDNMLTHAQSLRSLTLICPVGVLGEDVAVAAARSGLENNTTLRDLTLVSRGATTLLPILTSLHDHPFLRRLCLRGHTMDLDRLEAVLLSDTSKITELDTHSLYGGPPMTGLTHVLKALGRRPTLTKLRLHGFPLGHDEARQLGMVLRNTPSLQTLVLTEITLGSVGLAELAPALYRNTSIKVLDMSDNYFNSMEAAELLREILRRSKTITTLDLSGTHVGRTTGAVDCIADGLGSNSTLLNIDLSSCDLGDGGVSTLARNIGSRNTTLQKLTLEFNSITSTGVGVLSETMQQNIHHITDLDLQRNPIQNEGASLFARALGNNALPNLTRLSLSDCFIGDDGFIALISALEENKSLLHLDLCCDWSTSERTFLALAESLTEIKMLQRVDFNWCRGLTSVMPELLAGLCKNTSLLRFHVANCAPSSVPHSHEETANLAGGWMQE
jgi:Ran GTPase-activating protein (RanGAP) involved in mRNA processing and transport